MIYSLKKKGIIMSKTTKTTPSYNGNISVNGQSRANSWTDNGTVYSNYNMTDAEKAIYNYAQNALKDNMSQVNVFSPDVIKDMQSQVDAYTKQGQDIINNTYTPLITDLKNDIASRFGNLDNSSFMNNLNSIENKRATAESSLANDVMSKKNELVSDELQNRYDYLNFMNDIQNQMNDNILSYISKAVSNNSGSSSSSNSPDYSKYAALAATILSHIVTRR